MTHFSCDSFESFKIFNKTPLNKSTVSLVYSDLSSFFSILMSKLFMIAVVKQ
jgi:hypothetical protein